MSSFNVRLAEEKDLGSLKEFFKNVYGTGHIIADPEYFAWQYRDFPSNPFFPGLANLILTKGEDIIGHLGMIPYDFNFSGKKISAAFLASLIVHSDFRAFGGGAFLIAEAEKRFDICYTTGFNAAVAPVYKSRGWHGGTMKRRILKEFSGKEIHEPEGIMAVEKFDSNWNEAWERLKINFPVVPERTADYLNWRFLKHPKLKYEILGVFGKGGRKIGGYIVLRLEEGAEWRGVRIVDMIAEENDVRKLLESAKTYAGKNKAHFLDWFSTSEKYGDVLAEAGFHLDTQSDEDPPILILPADRKLRSINFTYKFCKKSSGLKAMPVDFFIVKADGDRDRPF